MVKSVLKRLVSAILSISPTIYAGQLENIGYTLPGKACEYNIQIMEERQNILSMGPGSSSKWMRAPEYRQLKQHMPKDVDVYHATIDALLEKRHRICEKFWEVV